MHEFVTEKSCHAGIQHTVKFSCCACELIATTLARGDLWPATLHNSRLAFSFALLDSAEALMLECQVALKDFCKALNYKCPFFILKVKIKVEIIIIASCNNYTCTEERCVINSFEEYR